MFRSSCVVILVGRVARAGEAVSAAVEVIDGWFCFSIA